METDDARVMMTDQRLTDEQLDMIVTCLRLAGYQARDDMSTHAETAPIVREVAAVVDRQLTDSSFWSWEMHARYQAYHEVFSRLAGHSQSPWLGGM